MGNAVQMSIHCNHCIKILGQALAYDLLADHLARMKSLVLAHVTQIGRDQCDVRNAHGSRALCCQDEFDQFLIGMIQAAAKHDTWGQMCRQAKLAFSVRKMM